MLRCGVRPGPLDWLLPEGDAMNFKDYMQAVAMLLPTLLLIVAAIVTLVLTTAASTGRA